MNPPLALSFAVWMIFNSAAQAQNVGRAMPVQALPLSSAAGITGAAPSLATSFVPTLAAPMDATPTPTPAPTPVPTPDPKNPEAAVPAQPALIEAAAQLSAAPEGAAGDSQRSDGLKKAFDGAKPGMGVSPDWVSSMIEKSAAVDARGARMNDVVQRLGFPATALNRAILTKHNESYNVELSRGPITDQKSSGRCWIFAGLNMVRSSMLAAMDEKAAAKAAKDLELSENYLHFFSMIEKSNSHLEDVQEKIYKKHPKKERFDAMKRRMTLSPKLGDGGWYEWFAFLVSKYGMMPKAAMPETISSEATAVLSQELDRSLAETSAQMLANAKLFKSGRAKNRSQELKEHGMNRVWKILVTHLGNPPATFDIRENGKPETVNGVTTTPVTVKTMTPQQYAKEVAKFDPADYILVSAYQNKKNNTVYEIKKSAIGKAQPGQPKFDLRYLNVSNERMMAVTAAAIKGGQPVWFAADTSQDANSKTGILHPAVYDRDAVYGFTPEEKAPPLDRKGNTYHNQVVVNHAMLLTGYDQPDPNGPIVKFKVENSWGDDIGSKGIFHMYREWYAKSVFEVVVHKRFLSEAEQAMWAGKAKQTKTKG